MSKTVLITGASGLIGKPLTERLIKAGYAVHQLSRNASKVNHGAKMYQWDPSSMQIDSKCIENVSVIIHLAGEGIADRPWTNKRKQEIIKSRTESLKLLYNLLETHPENEVKTFISSSAVGHYGDRKDEILSEDSEPGTDFLANTCLAWERAADKITNLGLRLVTFRTGVVLSTEGGALPKIAKPIKLGMGAPLGSGRQWMPWIHIHDVADMFLYAIENDEIEGVYNMASPFPVTNKTFTQAVAKQMNKSLWLPPVPALILRIIMGEMSRVVLNSNRTSSDKIVESGFKFKYPKLESALSELYG